MKCFDGLEWEPAESLTNPPMDLIEDQWSDT